MEIIKRIFGDKKTCQRKFFSELISQGHLCFDIGANVGTKTDLFLSLGANVVVVEPQQFCYDILKEKYDDRPDVQLEKIALGAADRESVMKISNESQLSTFSDQFVDAFAYQKQFHWNGREKVKIRTMDSLISKYGIPDFCKIDVEGYEFEVFQGLSHDLPLFSFEFNYPLRNLTLKCLDLLRTNESLIYNFVKFEHPKFALNQWVAADKIIEIIDALTPDIKTGDIYVKQVEK